MALIERLFKLVFVVVLASLISCGEKDDDDDTLTGDGYDHSIPSISFTLEIDDGAAALSLIKKEDALLTDHGDRINDSVEKVNEDLERVNREYAFSDTGEITGKGDDGKESGAFTEIDEDPYARQVVICHSGKVQILVKWSVDGKNIDVERDLNQKPDRPEDVKVKTVFSDDTEKTLINQFYGEPAGVPEGADGTISAAWDEAKQLADGSFTVRGVSDFFDVGDTLDADEYITGALNSAGTGQFVGFSVRAAECDGVTFSEADPTDTWCSSREVGAEGWYTSTEAAAAWNDDLKTIGVAPKANLGTPELDAACPE